jgi:hypothetical protein
MLSIARMTAMKEHIFYVALQEVKTRMVDWDKGVQDCAKQQLTKFLSHCRSKQQLQNNNIVNVMIVFTSYIVLQEATTMTIFFSLVLQGAAMMVDCSNRTRLRKQQPSFFINVDQPH